MLRFNHKLNTWEWGDYEDGWEPVDASFARYVALYYNVLIYVKGA